MFYLIKIAWRNILQSRSRTFLLGCSISFVTLFMIVFLSLTSGIEKKMLESATTLLSGDVNIAGFYKINQNSSAPIVMHYLPLYEYAKKNIPEAKFIFERIKAYGRIISDTTAIQLPMWGIDILSEKDFVNKLELIPNSGSNLNDLEKSGFISIFAAQAKKLNVKVGDSVTISMPTFRNMYNTKDVKIAAILKDIGIMSSFSVFLNSTDARNLYQMEKDTTGQIMIYLNSQKDLEKVEGKLREELPKMGYILMEKDPQAFWMKFERVSGESWTGQKLDITTWKDEISFLKWIVTVFQFLTYLVSFILLFIIVVGLINALWMSIKERTNEIGTLRAIGLQKNQVVILFFFESLLLSVTSSAIGILLGVGATLFLQKLNINLASDALKMFFLSDTVSFDLTLTNIFLPFVLITSFISIGALYPSYKASKMKPITAINNID